MLGDYHSKHVEFVKFSILHFSDCLLGVFSPSAGVIEFYMSVENIVPWKILFFGRYRTCAHFLTASWESVLSGSWSSLSAGSVGAGIVTSVRGERSDPVSNILNILNNCHLSSWQLRIPENCQSDFKIFQKHHKAFIRNFNVFHTHRSSSSSSMIHHHRPLVHDKVVELSWR